MCVALPSRVVWIGESTWGSIPGRAVVGDAEIEVELMLVPEVAVGDHVIIHSGYAIAVVSEDEAAKTQKLLGFLATDPPIHRSKGP